MRADEARVARAALQRHYKNVSNDRDDGSIAIVDVEVGAAAGNEGTDPRRDHPRREVVGRQRLERVGVEEPELLAIAGDAVGDQPRELIEGDRDAAETEA